MADKTTNELNEILGKVNTREELSCYLSGSDMNNFTKFSEYFNSLEKVRGLGKNKIIKDSGLDRTYGYQLLDLTKNKHLGRDKIIALSIAAGLDMKEMRRGLEIAGYSPLYSRDRRDAVIIFAVNQGLDVMKTNELLYEHGFEILKTVKD